MIFFRIAADESDHNDLVILKVCFKNFQNNKIKNYLFSFI